mmetsp:Transcript_4030/g.9047  ORF Transcript_4030/g.9047 Transcript_4030/m.9047 type:complete len:371 (+) Transcript_4030:2268-3380(+)
MSVIVDIILQRIHEYGYVAVRAENVLHLIRLNHQLSHRPRKFPHILVRGTPLLVPNSVELLRHEIDQSRVKRRTAERGIPRTAENLECPDSLFLPVLGRLVRITQVPHNADLQTPCTHVVKQIIQRFLVDAIDAEVQRCCRVLIDESEDVQIGEQRRIQQRATLVLRVETGHGQHAVLDGRGDSVRRSDVLGVREDHGYEFLRGEFLPVDGETDSRSRLVVGGFEVIMTFLQYLDGGMFVIAPEHDGHGAGSEVRLARHETGGVGAVESSSGIEENHLFGFSFGVEVGHDFQGRVTLDQGDLHVEGAEIYTEDGLGEGGRREGGKAQKEKGVGRPHLIKTIAVCFGSMNRRDGGAEFDGSTPSAINEEMM